MGKAQLGDEQAYRILLVELGEVISAYLHARFGRLDFVEDCVQECLIAIHCARHTYDTGRPFRPWLFALVRNKAIDMLRKQQNYRSLIGKSQINHKLNDSFDTIVNRGSVFAALKPEHREVLTLTKIIGLSTAEAAKKLNVSESTIKVRVHRAIKASRKILEAECR